MSFIVKGRNNAFVCENCGHHVPEAKSTVRDHCNKCLYSKHVDISPGDRQETCHGLMEPQCYKLKNGRIVIKYKCTKCGYIHNNKALEDDDVDEILKLTPCQSE